MNEGNDATDSEDMDEEVAQMPKRALKAAADAVAKALKGSEKPAPAAEGAATSGSSG